MSRQGDTYRPPPPPRDNYRVDPRDSRERPYDSRPYDDGRGDSRAGYGRPDERRAGWDDRGGGERDFKRGRYEDYDQQRGYDSAPPPRRDEYSSAPTPRHQVPPPQHQQYPPPPPQHQAYGAPAYPAPYQQPSPYPAPPQAYPPPPQHQPSAFPPADTRPPFIRSAERAEPPSASVVLLGLPSHVDDLILRNFLEDMGASIDSTTVIMDRATGLSKRYGFAKFSSVEHARAFVEPNWPAVSWKERGRRGADDGLKIKINYSQKTGGWREDQGAGARMTEDQRQATEAAQAPQTFYVNDGTRDIGSAPTQILLLRGLDALTSEEEIVAALANMGGRAASEISKGGIKKVMITKDRASRSSWGYAFVQLSDLATEVLANAFNPHLYPTGFRIRSSIIAFSFCHENSFIPIYAHSEWSFKGEGSQQLAYWDDKAFVSAWAPQGAEKAKVPFVAKSAQQTKDEEAAAAEADMEAFFSSIEAEVVPVVSEPAMAREEVQMMAPGMPGMPGSKALAPGTEEEERLKAIMRARKTREAAGESAGALAAASAVLHGEKKKSELIQTKKAAVNISKWNTKQQELKADVPAPAPPPSTLPSTDASLSAPSPVPSIAAAPALAAAANTTDEFAYGNPVAFVCLLCQRQFKSVDELRRHNTLSALHKTNLANSTTVTEATVRKVASLSKHVAGKSGTSTPSPAPQYVDRAAARREAFNQPNHPVRESKRAKMNEVPAPTPAPLEQPHKNGIEESNVGAKMLEKMGWSKGGGLGSTGSGIVDPIQAAQFQQGAGLGSTKGVAVGQYEATWKGYAEQVKDKARARLEEANKEDSAK